MKITLDGEVFEKGKDRIWRRANSTWAGHEMCERLNDKAKERGEDTETEQPTDGFLGD